MQKHRNEDDVAQHGGEASRRRRRRIGDQVHEQQPGDKDARYIDCKQRQQRRRADAEAGEHGKINQHNASKENSHDRLLRLGFAHGG
jgi:hypothetical protein